MADGDAGLVRALVDAHADADASVRDAAQRALAATGEGRARARARKQNQKLGNSEASASTTHPSRTPYPRIPSERIPLGRVIGPWGWHRANVRLAPPTEGAPRKRLFAFLVPLVSCPGAPRVPANHADAPLSECLCVGPLEATAPAHARAAAERALEALGGKLGGKAAGPRLLAALGCALGAADVGDALMRRGVEAAAAVRRPFPLPQGAARHSQ